MSTASDSKWRDAGVRIISSDQLDANTPQTPGCLNPASNFWRNDEISSLFDRTMGNRTADLRGHPIQRMARPGG
jgi:hypothetical protein